MRALVERWNGTPLRWQVLAANAAALLATALALVVAVPVAVVVAVVLVPLVNVVVVGRATRFVEELAGTMQRVDLLHPGQRLAPVAGSTETEALRAAFNRMLDGLEAERREMSRRTLLAQEEERRRLARGLHDELNQTVAGVMLRLRAIADRSDGRGATELKAAEDDLRAVSGEVENIVNRLRPETLDDLGLVSALMALSEEFERRSGIEVERRFGNGLPDLDPEAELVLYRIAQESLTNVAVHARASRLSFEVSAAGNAVRLRVGDDGIGIGTGIEGNGIRGMRERALLVDAALDIGPSADGGTEVEVVVPARTIR